MAKRNTQQQTTLEPKQWESIEEIDHAKKRIQRRIKELEALDIAQAVTTGNGAQHQVMRNISNTILEIYGEMSPEYKDHKHISLISGSFPIGASLPYKIDMQERGRERVLGVLNSLLVQLDEKREDIEERLNTSANTMQNIDNETQQKNDPKNYNIFLVHGHDNGALHTTARFLEKLKLDVIILREQPNQGRTIIEKFVEYSDAGFAVVLLTPDDRGGTSECQYESQKLRARQNVILELGYFLGKLGRENVAALYTPGVEIPSDYSGVIFIEIDSNDGWKFQLVRELNAAGFEINMNLFK